MGIEYPAQTGRWIPVGPEGAVERKAIDEWVQTLGLALDLAPATQKSNIGQQTDGEQHRFGTCQFALVLDGAQCGVGVHPTDERQVDLHLSSSFGIQRQQLAEESGRARPSVQRPQHRFQPLGDALNHAAEREAHKLVLGCEVVTQRTRRHARLCRDRPHRNEVDPVAPNHSPQCLRKLAATLIMVDSPRHPLFLAQLCHYVSGQKCEKGTEMILAAIVVCEVGFWVLLVAGVLARYGLNRHRLGAALLACVPAVDLALLAFTVVDMRGGAEPRLAHGLAAVYLGVSVAFGHSMIRWADVRAAHRFAGGPAPTPTPAGGTPERLRHEWREFGKAALAVAMSSVFILGAVALAGDRTDTSELYAWLPRLGLVLFIWLAGGPLAQAAQVLLAGRRSDHG